MRRRTVALAALAGVLGMSLALAPRVSQAGIPTDGCQTWDDLYENHVQEWWHALSGTTANPPVLWQGGPDWGEPVNVSAQPPEPIHYYWLSGDAEGHHTTAGCGSGNG
jgi:hypothetical protein